jgi:predicted  nucleic acid-binding Zn-ribbon protein
MSKEVKIKITVDGKQVEKSVKDLTKEFNVAEKSVAEINKRLKELREASTQVATGSQEFKELNEEIRRLNLETRQASGALNELGQREPLSNVRKGFEDSALAISSVNAVLGIANQLFEGNEKIQKLITRAQTAFNIVLTATQLIKEKEAIADGIRNARLAAYNALLPVATNLTRIFGVTTAQAMAIATGGISLLITGVALLIANWENLIDTTDGRIGQLESESSELDFQLELMKLRNVEESLINDKKIQQLETQQKLIDLELEELQLSIARNTLYDQFLDLFGKSRQELLTELIRKKELNQAEIDGLRIKNEKLKADKKQTKETEKQRDLQKEISDFIKGINTNLQIELTDSFVKISEKLLGVSSELENLINKTNQFIFGFRRDLTDNFGKASDLIIDKIASLNLEFLSGKISVNEYNKAVDDLTQALFRVKDESLKAEDSIKQIETALTEITEGEFGKGIQNIIKPITDLNNSIKSLSGSTSTITKDFKEYKNQIIENLQIQEKLSNSNDDLRIELENLIDEQKTNVKLGLDTEAVQKKIVEATTKLIKNTTDITKLESTRVQLQDKIVSVGNQVVKNLEDQTDAYTKLENQLKSIDEEIISYQNEIVKLSQEESEVNKQRIKDLEAIIELLNKSKVALVESFDAPEAQQAYSKFTKRFDEINKKSDTFFEKFRGEVVVIQQSLQAVLEIGQAAGDLRIAKIQQEIDIMEERYARELELISRTADEDARRIEDSLLSEEVKADAIRVLREREANDNRIIELRREQERKKLERERNLAQQRSQISQAIMGAALAVIQAFAQLGPIAGAIAAAGVGITTGLQIATIRKQKFNKGGKVKGPGSGMSDSIPAMLSNGESVINANSTKMFEPLLSKINEIGGGVRFNRGGVAGDTPTMAQSEIVDIEKLARRIGEEMRSNPVKAYVIGNEVSNQQQIDAQIKRRSIV